MDRANALFGLWQPWISELHLKQWQEQLDSIAPGTSDSLNAFCFETWEHGHRISLWDRSNKRYSNTFDEHFWLWYDALTKAVQKRNPEATCLSPDSDSPENQYLQVLALFETYLKPIAALTMVERASVFFNDHRPEVGDISEVKQMLKKSEMDLCHVYGSKISEGKIVCPNEQHIIKEMYADQVAIEMSKYT